MKKKLALLLAAVMVAAMVPVSAFAKTDNRVDRVVVVEKDKKIETVTTAPKLIVEQKADNLGGEQFYVVLEGAEWDATVAAGDITITNGTVTKLSSTEISVAVTSNGNVTIDLGKAKVTGDEATVTIDPNNSVVSAGTYVFARTASKNATAKISKTVTIPEEGGAVQIKDITITETVAATLKTGTVNHNNNPDGKGYILTGALPTEYIKLRVYGDFKFDATAVPTINATNDLAITSLAYSADGTEAYFGVGAQSTAAAKAVISGLKVIPTKYAEAGDVAEIVISGAGVEKTTLEVGTVVAYGVTFTVQDKKLPVFYSGRTYNDDETLEVTVKETAPESWWTSRKTTFTFPEGVEVVDVTVKDSNSDTTIADGNFTVDENVVTLTGATVAAGKCAEFDVDFNLAIAPTFTGDITCVLGGPAVAEDIEVVVAEALAPVTFEVVSTDVSIDYRNVAIGDIVIKEAYAGALEKNDVLSFAIDSIPLEKGAKIEVVEGDGKAKLDSTTYDGDLNVVIEKESYKTPATFKITNIQAYLNRSLPAGSYALELVANYSGNPAVAEAYEGYFKNYDATKDQTGTFTTKSIELAKAYVEVVTAGRDQDDSSFTTQVAITIGADTMTVGQKTVALEVPAYIANGYTMLPVRAVADALSGEAATVLWDDATKTVTIAFGARIISMTIGSKVMNINGVAIQMNAAPEITNNRTFLPLRDLGYALGLTDADINWNAETATATLN